ncbi:MAG: succinylglutamate desuccinylase/aspartoacylase family protein [Bacteroidota bacterium]
MDVRRVIGSFGKGEQGPLLFCIGGIHGNEPAGVLALQRVIDRLETLNPPFAGKLMALSGNVIALKKQQRYIDRDLNRLWSEEEIVRIKSLAPADRNSEEKELLELMRFIQASAETPYEPKIYVDLHTTSAPGGLFSIVTDDSAIRQLAEVLKAPIIFNLVDELALTTNKFFDTRGLTGLAFEAGQHDDASSIDNHEAAIWILLAEIGCIHPRDIPDFGQYAARLSEATKELDNYLSVCYRHPISATDQFRMNRGYVNFQSVKQGEYLAEDKDGEILSPCNGQMLMPLYQNQGEDGFFVIEALDEPPV